MKVLVFVILFFSMVSAGCTPVADTQAVFTPRPVYTSTPTKTLIPTRTRRPTYTPNNTSTPTLTPGVTPTLKYGDLNCSMINSKHVEGITDLQWAEYAKSVVSRESYFSGVVRNVDVNGVVVLVDNDQPCTYLLYNIPLSRAIRINKNQFMQGYGAITAIDYTDVAYVNLNVLVDTLIIR